MRFKNAKPRYSYSHDYGTTEIVSSGRSILGVGPQLARPFLDFEAGDYIFIYNVTVRATEVGAPGPSS